MNHAIASGRRAVQSLRVIPMTKIVVDMSMSLDGFIAGPDDTPAQPFGNRNAEQLHDWLFSGRELHPEGFLRPEGRNVQLVDAMYSSTGAWLCGRRLYDLVNGWNGSHPLIPSGLKCLRSGNASGDSCSLPGAALTVLSPMKNHWHLK
jgi:hypothetical protein